MREPITNTTNNDEKDVLEQQDTITEHTCACGEQHSHREGTPSHRESCTSTLKFGNSCCCQSDDDTKNVPHPCGHGPRCQ
jgi:hypothetical protein